ncbi:MAG: hypothetical protein AAF215_09670 [Cyanobacteria bacterium P01_A01_bin.123]
MGFNQPLIGDDDPTLERQSETKLNSFLKMLPVSLNILKGKIKPLCSGLIAFIMLFD